MTFLPTVRTRARQEGIDLAGLINILCVRRPADSNTEAAFVMRYLDPIPGMQADAYGNRYLKIGDNPTVLWSCHTDTVSSDEGLQNVRWDGDTLVLNHPTPGQTLGADDGAGMWLLLEMIKANKPGLYVFHRDEEIGGLGSKYIADKTPELLAGIQMAIAFDRKATHSVITFQRSNRCCSDEFGQALADALGMGYKLDDGGVFTDTASYTKLIPECTNLSVGYYNEHTSRESLDVAHLLDLRAAVLALNTDNLPIARDPSVVESKYKYGSWGGYGGWADYGDDDYYYYGSARTKSDTQAQSRDFDASDELLSLVKSYPVSIARWLTKLGFTPRKLEDQLWSNYDDEPLEPEELELLYCDDCGEYTPQEWLPYGCIEDGGKCPQCDSEKTYLVVERIDPETGELILA